MPANLCTPHRAAVAGMAHRPGRTTALLAVLAWTTALATLAAPLPAAAQANDRDRVALRRTQAALQQAQQARETLQAERDSLDRSLAEVQAAAAERQRAAATLRRTLAQAEEALAHAEADAAAALAYERSQHAAVREADAVAAAGREQALGSELAATRRDVDELRATNSTLVRQLAAQSQAIDDTQRRITAMNTLAHEALTQYRDKGLVEQTLQRDRVFGLTGVRVENEVALARQRLDGLLMPGSAPRQ